MTVNFSLFSVKIVFSNPVSPNLPLSYACAGFRLDCMSGFKHLASDIEEFHQLY